MMVPCSMVLLSGSSKQPAQRSDEGPGRRAFAPAASDDGLDHWPGERGDDLENCDDEADDAEATGSA